MTDDRWAAVDDYLVDHLHAADPALDAALDASAAAGLPAIAVSATQGKLLHLLARAAGARRILEIGTLGGYSTIWLARALPLGGQLVTLELDATNAAIARGNLVRAGLGGVVDVRVGPALDSLHALADEGAAPFDLVFIDADKPTTAEYFDWAVALCRRGSLIVVDNVVREGALADAASEDRDVQGMRRFVEHLAQDRRVTATGVQTVGAKGYDGFVLAVVIDDG